MRQVLEVWTETTMQFETQVELDTYLDVLKLRGMPYEILFQEGLTLKVRKKNF